MISLGEPRVYLGPSEQGTTPGDSASAGVVSAAFSLGIVAIAFGAVRGLGWLVSEMAARQFFGRENPFAAFVAGAAVVLFGAVLYLLRKRRRGAYGYLELGSGFGVAFQASYLSRGISDAALWVALLGAGYVVVRGFESLAIARTGKEGGPSTAARPSTVEAMQRGARG